MREENGKSSKGNLCALPASTNLSYPVMTFIVSVDNKLNFFLIRDDSFCFFWRFMKSLSIWITLRCSIRSQLHLKRWLERPASWKFELCTAEHRFSIKIKWVFFAKRNGKEKNFLDKTQTINRSFTLVFSTHLVHHQRHHHLAEKHYSLSWKACSYDLPLQ